MPFNYLMGLYALLALIPFILIYLIRPKSFEKMIPSLMFIMQEKQKFKKTSFLQKLLQNILFIIQLFIILFLAVSVASPYLEIPHSIMVRNNIIVLDASASMQTKDGINTRFSKAVSEAKNNLGFKNTIILAENTPVVILEDGSSGEALNLLDKLQPKATTTDLGDAVLLAADLLGNKKGVIAVISDFMPTEGSDLLMAKQSLTSKGNNVKFIDVSNKAENIGIVDLIVNKDETIAEIKNYENKEVTIKATLLEGSTKVDEKILKLLPMSKEKITFETPSGISTISLDVKDDLDLDNIAYLSSPAKKKTKVLLITNFQDGNKIKAALTAIKDIDLDVREPPTINAYNIGHDIVIISDITKKLFVPTDMKDIKKYVEKGGILVINAQEDLKDIDTLDLLPVKIEGKEDKTTSLCVDIIGKIFPKDPFADEPCFSSASKHLKAAAKNESTTLVSAQLDNSPIMSIIKKESGQVFYYGIIDKYSGFYSDPFYPIFWNNLIGYLMKTEDIKEYNYKGGKTIIVSDQEVKTPSANLKTNKLLLDEAGIYEFNKKKVAVNLADEKESDISRENIELKDELRKQYAEKVNDVDIVDLEIPLLIAALVILFIEFIYIKFRGDL